MRILSFVFLYVRLFEEVQPGIVLRRKVSEGILTLTRTQYNHVERPPLPFLSKTELAVDLLMIADYSLYNGFVEMARGDQTSAQAYVEEYLTAVFDQMKGIYDHIPINNGTLKLNKVGSIVIIREEDCPLIKEFDEVLDLFNETYVERNLTMLSEKNNSTSVIENNAMQATDAIAKMTTWVKHYYPYLPGHDHAILLTKYDLLSPRGESSTQGMAYVGEICRIGESSSVVEDIGAAATALIAAHELGHSLGSFHDGSNDQSKNCNSDDNFLMATTVSGGENDVLFANTRTMSNCSKAAIEESLKSPNSLCLRKQKALHSEKGTTNTTSKLPGERFSLHHQCQITFGSHYGVCLNSDYTRGISICRRIWCKNRVEKRSAPCETKTFLPAFDGTRCGRNRWCIGGECIINENMLKDCHDLNRKTCSRYSKVKLRHYCKASSFREICCNSCERLKEL